MKHKIRDILIFCIDVLGISALYRMYHRRQGPLVRAIVFHDVADAGWFKEVIDHCVRHYNVLTPADFHAQKFDLSNINILLTFDDGYQSWVDVCAPILAQYNQKGLFFVNTRLPEIALSEAEVAVFMKEQLNVQPKRALTNAGVDALVAGGHTLGGHTHTHPNMATLSTLEIIAEISQNKALLKEACGREILDFAYPFGRREHKTPEVLQLLRDVGYTNVYTAETGFMKQGDVELPRMCIENNQSLKSISRWIGGGYDMFKSIK